jgi:DNA primase
MLNEKQRNLLTDAAQRYSNLRNEATASYLLARGISKTVADMYLLGSVADPSSGHEQAVGMLSIPYMTPSGVVGMKFRRLDDGTPKYLWPTGQKVGLFNVNDLHKHSDTIAICEGEIDTIILSGVVGIPSVGVAGVSQWKPWFKNLFEPYSRVLIFADNDVKEDGRNPGQELAKRIKEELDKATVVHLPDNTDVNEVLLKYGSEWFNERIAA